MRVPGPRDHNLTGLIFAQREVNCCRKLYLLFDRTAKASWAGHAWGKDLLRSLAALLLRKFCGKFLKPLPKFWEKICRHAPSNKVTAVFNPTEIAIEAFTGELTSMYDRTYGILEPSYPGVIRFVAGLALENIATSDAAYHDVNHTIQVTLVGQEILRGQHINPREWLRFIVPLLCHDIGYVRGICRGDAGG